MRFGNSLAVLILAIASSSNGQNAKPELDLAFVHIQTVRAAASNRSGADMAPNLVVRLFGKGREIFAYSGEDGSVVVPLRPGKYCMELFTKDLRRLTLSSIERRCFDLSAEHYLEVAAVAAYNPTLEVLPPPPRTP